MFKKNLIRNIFIVVCFIIYVFFLLSAYIKFSRAKKNPTILNGVQLLNASHVPRSSRIYTCHFIFNHNGTKVEIFKRNAIDIRDAPSKVNGKFFPIIYERGNPSNAYILITKENFERFNVPFPDSLQWLYY